LKLTPLIEPSKAASAAKVISMSWSTSLFVVSAVKAFAALSGMVKALLSAATVLVKVICPLPGAVSVQVRSVKVATPATAALVSVPPMVQTPVPALAVATTLAVAEGPLAQVLLY